MNATRKHTLLISTLSISLLVASAGYADDSHTAQAAHNQSQSLTQPPAQANSLTVPPDYDTYLLTESKDVYTQLQLARQAAIGKDKAGFTASLATARDALYKVQVPQQVQILDKQLGIIKQDLNKHSGKLDSSLWIPVEAQLRDALLFSSDTIITNATSSARKGVEAARNNDNNTARTALDEVVEASTYNLGAFPLSKVREDIDSASEAADNAQPYWPGALEAIQSALATFHWYDESPSHGLLKAYTNAVNAYTLATSPDFLPEQNQDVLNQLSKVVDELKDSPDTNALQTEAQALIDKVTPDNSAIKQLVKDIRKQVNDQRRQSEDQYLQNLDTDIANNL